MRFKDYIVQSEHTHDQLALMIGCARVTITQISQGKRRPSLSLCRRILLVAKGQVTADDLIAEFGHD
tara:strand:+ start:196 stop:396 length:201 start_codon:yes stop_codon:yes gene_type:complete